LNIYIYIDININIDINIFATICGVFNVCAYASGDFNFNFSRSLVTLAVLSFDRYFDICFGINSYFNLDVSFSLVIDLNSNFDFRID